MKKMKPSVKAALASTLVVTSTAAIVYANSDSIESKNTENDKNLALAVEKVDSNTVKVSIDNIVDIPKSLQFSIALEGAELENGDASIRDLVKKEAETRLANNEYSSSSNNILTDYTYNSESNTIDVLITAEDSIPKTGNKIDVFELDVRNASAGLFSSKAPTYKVLPNEDLEYKYVTNTNKEVVSEGVSYEDKSITMNVAPTISLKENAKYAEVVEGGKLALTPENLGIEIADEDGEIPTLEVKYGDKVIKEFTSNTPGIYSLTATAVDSYGEKSETITVQVNVLREEVTEEPTITRDGKPLENVTINSGDIFDLMKGVTAVDAKNREVVVEVKSDKKVNLEPDVDTVYKLTYTATDDYGNTKEEIITLTVKANNAPVIEGVKNHVLTVGDDFDATAGVTVYDVEDDEVELKVDSNVNTREPGEYIVRYSATDSGNKTTRAESKVVVNPKMEAINNVPVITAEDVTIEVGQDFNPKSYATAWDVEDKDLTDSITYTTDLKAGVPGVYTVTYTVKDSKGATATKTIKVTVNPKMEGLNNVPVITAEDVTIQVGQNFDPKSYATAWDVEDEDLTGNIEYTTDFKEGVVGVYTVTYTVKDSKGATATKTIKVTVNPKMEGLNNVPVITAEDVVIQVGQNFDPKSYATAWDVEDEDLTGNIEYTTDFKEGVVGVYTVTYTVKDSKGATATKTIKVTVKEKIVIAESITINNKFDKLYVGSQKALNATVNEEADIKNVEWETSDENIAYIEVIGNSAKVISKSEGEVTITAKTTDGSEKSDSVTISIVNFKDESTIPLFIKDIVDSNVVMPVAGTGEENSPLELEVQNIAVEEFNKFLKELENLQPSLVELYEDGNFTVYKIKLSRKARLFRSSAEGYIEIRIDNRLVSTNDYKASIDKLLANNQPEQPENPGQPEQPEEPGQGGNTNEGSNQNQGGNTNQENNQNQSGTQDNTDNDGKTENEKPSFGGIKLPATGQESILGYVGVAAVAIGGLLFGIKKKKK